MSDPANTVSEKEPGMPTAAPESTPPPAQDDIKEGGVVPEQKKKREYKDFGHEEEKATRAYLFFHIQQHPALLRVSRANINSLLLVHHRCKGRHVPGACF